jgi:hypothetical protein
MMRREYGELIVSGKDSVKIKLMDNPRYIDVHFRHHHHHHPCSPIGHKDFYDWEVDRIAIRNKFFFFKPKYTYYLVIKWNVADSRLIEWECKFS